MSVSILYVLERRNGKIVETDFITIERVKGTYSVFELYQEVLPDGTAKQGVKAVITEHLAFLEAAKQTALDYISDLIHNRWTLIDQKSYDKLSEKVMQFYHDQYQGKRVRILEVHRPDLFPYLHDEVTVYNISQKGGDVCFSVYPDDEEGSLVTLILGKDKFERIP